MSTTQRIGETLTLKNVRLAFPNVFSPRAMKDEKTGETRKRHDATFIFSPEHEAFTAVQQAIIKVAKQKWGDDKGLAYAKALLQRDQTCLHNGDLKALKYDGFAGNWYVSASNKTRPAVVHCVKDPATGKAKVLTEADGVIYAGCYVNAIIEVYPFEGREGKKDGIYATLLGIQFAGDGDAFGGRTASPDDFEALDALPEGAPPPWENASGAAVESLV